MLLQRDPRFETIKPTLNDGKIHKFSDIFLYVKITSVARSLGKRTTRFKELVANVEDFYIRELVIIARLFNLTAEEVLSLVAKQLSPLTSVEEEVLFPGLASLVNDGKIRLLSDILPYIEISKLANLLGRNSSRLKELIENVEDFQVKKLIEMSRHCGLSVSQIFSLIAAQIDRRNIHGKNKVHM